MFVRGILQQLLAKVVAEGVRHQISKVGKRLAKNDISMFRDPFLQLFLEVTTTVLVFAQAGDFTNEVLESGASKAID